MAIRFLRSIFLLIWVLATLTFVCPFPNNVTDQQALLSFKASITDDPLGVLDSWNSSIHFCQWNGVICSPRRQRVTTLDLSSQQLAGTLSSHIGNLSFLRDVVLYDNAFHGIIPNEIGRLIHLQYISLTNNSFEGEFPANLSHCKDILGIKMYMNNLQGKLPIEFGSWTKLTVFNLGRNRLTGSIPPSIGNTSSLVVLNLNYNKLSGVIPLELAHLANLGTLFLQNNSLWGMVPLPLYNIGLLVLAGNFLTGTIPEAIGELSNLVELYLSDNNITGVIPTSISNITKLGPLPSNIGNLKQLVGLRVSNNKLTGDIPTSLGDCVMLEELHMEGNFFEGRIPASFEALKSLTIVDLSSNHISENIPHFFGGLHLIEFLNLSHNRLQGEVPKEGLFSNVSRYSVIDNSRLCGGIQALHLPSCPVEIIRNKKKTLSCRMILLLVFISLSILLACFAFLFYRRRRSKQMNFPVPVQQENQYPRLSYKDLLLATNEFSPDNLLGEGRYGKIYKGFLEPLNQIVAVKVLDVEVHGVKKSFLAECEKLRNIRRHRNLIKIITACSSIDFKGNDFRALVYVFMTNGSLDNWLHPSPSYQRSEKNLTLLQRLNISIDIAMGLNCLHHHSHTSIIHCDIKPSNILLDEEFVARVGDFGLSRFSFATTLDNNEAKLSSTAVRGTVGYVPPEYGIGGKISAEGDVYSYGILLLEMFTGEQPTGSSTLLENGNNLHDYVKKALPHRLMDIVDPHMVLDQEQHGLTENESHIRDTVEVCLTSIFEVGLACSVATPRERIDISVAMKKLHVARNKLLHHGQ